MKNNRIAVYFVSVIFLLFSQKIIGTGVSSVSIPNDETIINVSSCSGDATMNLQEAIDSAARLAGKKVKIILEKGVYHVSRKNSSPHIYHISNTTSKRENPDPTKHIGLWFRNLDNVIFEGNGSTIVTHGEMTPFVIDSCSNIMLSNFSLTASDPTVPEIKILSKDDTSITFEVVSPSEFIMEDGGFAFTGEGWKLGYGKSINKHPMYSQVFYPDRNVTLRCNNPLKDILQVEKTGERVVRAEYAKSPEVNPGEYYQFRHTFRNEAGGFINMSKDIELKDIDFYFLGNFGIVSQFSENLTFDSLRFQPEKENGKTVAGFADFLQFSGCRGKVVVKNSVFEGSHDDAINVHGTYLRAVESSGPKSITARYSHGQTFGFQPFFVGDSIEIINLHTLNPVMTTVVEGVAAIDEYDYEIKTKESIFPLPSGLEIEDLAIENISWCPEVEITGNYFARTPTRGILLTTRGKSAIEGNMFFRIPMPAILVSDDARKWYESGPVKDLTIRNNKFVECTSPVISIAPEIEIYDKPVHGKIVIEDNEFIGVTGDPIFSVGVENLIVK